MPSSRLTLAAQRRLESCLVLAKRGATAGERAAAKAAAERIAQTAGISLAAARGADGSVRPSQPTSTWTPPAGWAAAWQRSRAKPRKPRKPSKPPTVADRLREKAERDAMLRQRAAATDRRIHKELAEQVTWEADQRAMQAERDRAWAQQQEARA